MSRNSIDVISGCACNAKFPADSFLFREGRSADKFYCLKSGRVALEIFSPDKGAVRIDTRESGSVIGWSWIVEPFTWYCDARAVQESRVVELDARCLRGKFESDTVLAYELYRRFVPLMHRSLEATRLQLMDLYRG